MTVYSNYISSVGMLRLSADDEGVTGLDFLGEMSETPETLDTSETPEKPETPEMPESSESPKIPALAQTTKHLHKACAWLDAYFAGRNPAIDFPVHYEGTAFQVEVWDILRTIPYGQTMSYGDIAKTIADRRGISRMSAQAVGGAVGRNPIAIIVPCHRVLGNDGSLTGFGGGIETKKALLSVEGIEWKK